MPAAAVLAAGLSLKVKGVDLRFGGIHAPRGVSFEAAPGQITAVIGPNGAGKTSVFNTISGFYRPAAGCFWLGGQDITDAPVHRRAGMGLARTFQNIALFRGLTVLENIKLGGHPQRLTWVLSGLVGTVAGVLIASSAGLSPLLAAAALGVFAAIILGGMDSVPGAIVASLIVGWIEALGAGYLGGKSRDVLPYVVVLAILVVRPYRIFGTRSIERL